MSKIQNREEAVQSIKSVNDSAHRIFMEIEKISSELKNVSTYLKLDAEQYNSVFNQYNVRIAGSEMTRLSRKLAQTLPVLKVLMKMRVPNLVVKEEPEDEPQEELVNKIDKNVDVVSKIHKDSPYQNVNDEKEET